MALDPIFGLYKTIRWVERDIELELSARRVADKPATDYVCIGCGSILATVPDIDRMALEDPRARRPNWLRPEIRESFSRIVEEHAKRHLRLLNL